MLGRVWRDCATDAISRNRDADNSASRGGRERVTVGPGILIMARACSYNRAGIAPERSPSATSPQFAADEARTTPRAAQGFKVATAILTLAIVGRVDVELVRFRSLLSSQLEQGLAVKGSR